jgi:hypothetical protein
MYADDLLLITSSVNELQSMLNMCGHAGTKLGIVFNAKKSCCLMIGPSVANRPISMKINGCAIEWVNELKYLGVHLCQGKKFSVNLSYVRRNFFASVNSVLSKCAHVSDMVKLELLEKHCLPLLTYCVESLFLTTKQIKDLNAYWNCVYRKIFMYNKWESVRELVMLLGRLDLSHIIYLKSVLFLKKLEEENCELYKTLCSVTCNADVLYYSKMNVNTNWSRHKINNAVVHKFQESINVNK